MDTQEIDSTLDELESRLDRLRALYEQYFLGIEKIEPAVARKDVDRRFWMLRKVQIRNTARRWRLQVLIQRYNTFQQYWTRICREIENGTYVRHLLKAKKNLGAEPKTWAAKKRMGLLRRDRVPNDANGAPAGADADGPSALPEGEPTGNDGKPSSAPPQAAAAPHGAPRPARPPPAAVTLTLDDLGPLELDFDDDDEPTPPPRQAVKRVSVAPAPRSPVAAPGASAARPSPGPLERPRAPLPARSPASPASPAPGVAAKPAAAAPSAARAPAPAAPTPVPAAASPTRAAPAASPKGAAVPVSSASSLISEERVQKLHAELVAAKRQLNQGDNVSMASLAKSLRETEAKLRAQHAGRSVDFQIVVKDGKPVVKPVVRR